MQVRYGDGPVGGDRFRLGHLGQQPVWAEQLNAPAWASAQQLIGQFVIDQGRPARPATLSPWGTIEVSVINVSFREPLDSLTVNVPKDLRADYYDNTKRGRVVEILTWGKLPFEFAHFTDRQLADAMISVAAVPPPNGREWVVNGLHMQRTRDPTPDVEDVFWNGARLRKRPWPTPCGRRWRGRSTGRSSVARPVHR